MKGVALIVDAVHEINPDVVVMYYSLSPLFISHFDIHSPDDLFLCGEDYQIEANRRFFFSGLLGEIGMPTFSSSGYDWLSVRDIWFDAAAIGTIASLNSFSGDEQASGPTPLRVAKYNGLSQITRSTNVFTVEALDPVLLGSTSGAHSSSWVRLEGGEPTLVALRAFGLTEKEVSVTIRIWLKVMLLLSSAPRAIQEFAVRGNLELFPTATVKPSSFTTEPKPTRPLPHTVWVSARARNRCLFATVCFTFL